MDREILTYPPKIAAHAGFHVDGRGDHRRRLGEHHTGVVHPTVGLGDGVNTITTHGAEDHHQNQWRADPEQNFGFRLQACHFLACSDTTIASDVSEWARVGEI